MVAVQTSFILVLVYMTCSGIQAVNIRSETLSAPREGTVSGVDLPASNSGRQINVWSDANLKIMFMYGSTGELQSAIFFHDPELRIAVAACPTTDCAPVVTLNDEQVPDALQLHLDFSEGLVADIDRQAVVLNTPSLRFKFYSSNENGLTGEVVVLVDSDALQQNEVAGVLAAIRLGAGSDSKLDLSQYIAADSQRQAVGLSAAGPPVEQSTLEGVYDSFAGESDAAVLPVPFPVGTALHRKLRQG